MSIVVFCEWRVAATAATTAATTTDQPCTTELPTGKSPGLSRGNAPTANAWQYGQSNDVTTDDVTATAYDVTANDVTSAAAAYDVINDVTADGRWTNGPTALPVPVATATTNGPTTTDTLRPTGTFHKPFCLTNFVNVRESLNVSASYTSSSSTHTHTHTHSPLTPTHSHTHTHAHTHTHSRTSNRILTCRTR